MQTNYKLLCSVTFFHSYYKDEKCKDLVLSPSIETSQVLQKYNLYFHVNQNIIEIYYNSDKQAKDLLEYILNIENVSTFTFEFDSNNTDFMMFTESPVNELFQFEFNSQKQIESSETDFIQLKTSFKSIQEPGKLGIVTIHFNNILSFYSEENAANFSVNFLARKTIWENYIINRSNSEFNNLTIKNEAGFTFEGPIETNLSIGEKALMFKSIELIALSETHRFKTSLISFDLHSIEKTIVNGLPIPNPSSFFRNQEEDVLSSPIYIYI